MQRRLVSLRLSVFLERIDNLPKTGSGQIQGKLTKQRRFSLSRKQEPLHPDDLEGYIWLRDRSPVAIAAGENESGRHEFAPWIEQRALDYYQVDLGKCGVTDAVEIRKRVEDSGATIVNHCCA
jgi:hypothetical protein